MAKKKIRNKVKSQNNLLKTWLKNWKLNLLSVFIFSIPLLGVPSSFPLRPIPDLLILGILGSWIYQSFKKRSSGFSASPIDWGIWAMLIFNLLSGFQAIQTDLWLGNVLGFLVGILFYFIFRNFIQSEKNIQRLVSASLYSLIPVLLIGIWQLLMFLQVLPQWSAFEWLWAAGRLPRISATFIDALNYAAFLAIVFPYLLIQSLTEKRVAWQWFWRIIMVLFIINALLTQGRALLAAAIAVTIAVAFILKQYWKPLLYWVLVLILASSVMKPQVLVKIHPGFLKTTTALGQNYDNEYFNKARLGTADREVIWGKSADYILKYPLGIGGGNSARILPEKYQNKWGKGTPGPHNIFMGFTLELGVFGGLYFLGFIIWLLVRLFQSSGPKKLAAAYVFAALLGFIAYHQFVDSYTITPNVIYFWLLLAMSSVVLQEQVS